MTRTGDPESVARSRRVLALCGIVGPVVFWGTVLVLGTLDPDYNHLQHAMSVVGSLQAPFSPVGRAAFVLEGLLLVTFAVGLYRDLEPGRVAAAGAAMIAIHGVGRIGEGVFAWNNLLVNSFTNTLHTISGIAAVASMLVAPLLLAWMFRTDDRWRSAYGYTVAASIAFLAVFVVIGPLTPTTVVPLGLGQRIGFGIWYLWLVGLAVLLFRRAPTESEIDGVRRTTRNS